MYEEAYDTDDYTFPQKPRRQLQDDSEDNDLLQATWSNDQGYELSDDELQHSSNSLNEVHIQYTYIYCDYRHRTGSAALFWVVPLVPLLRTIK